MVAEHVVSMEQITDAYITVRKPEKDLGTDGMITLSWIFNNEIDMPQYMVQCLLPVMMVIHLQVPKVRNIL